MVLFCFLFYLLLYDLKGDAFHAAVGAFTSDEDGGGAAFCVVVVADDFIVFTGQIIFGFSGLFVEYNLWRNCTSCILLRRYFVDFGFGDILDFLCLTDEIGRALRAGITAVFGCCHGRAELCAGWYFVVFPDRLPAVRVSICHGIVLASLELFPVKIVDLRRRIIIASLFIFPVRPVGHGHRQPADALRRDNVCFRDAPAVVSDSGDFDGGRFGSPGGHVTAVFERVVGALAQRPCRLVIRVRNDRLRDCAAFCMADVCGHRYFDVSGGSFGLKVQRTDLERALHTAGTALFGYACGGDGRFAFIDVTAVADGVRA